jgi:hypothetical protein
VRTIWKAKGRKCENVLWICNDPITMYFKHRRKNEGWPYNWRCYNRVELCFYHVNCDLWQNNFHNEFSICGHAHMFFFFAMICIHLKCYTPIDVHLIMCALCEKKWLKKLMHLKRNKILFSSMLFLCVFILTIFILICVSINWLSFMHDIIIKQHMFYDLNPFIPLQICFKWHRHSSFKREEKILKHSNLTYLLTYLTKMKKKTKPFENEIIQNKLIKQWSKRYICE